jgi:hypothetical protein
VIRAWECGAGSEINQVGEGGGAWVASELRGWGGRRGGWAVVSGERRRERALRRKGIEGNETAVGIDLVRVELSLAATNPSSSAK